MRRAIDFIQYEQPNEHTRIGRLINSLTTRDSSILAALTHIYGKNSQRNDFNEAADFIFLTAQINDQSDRSQNILGNKNEGIRRRSKKGYK